MKQILHILNGDATKAIFIQTEIEGEIAVWREVMTEGPIFGDPSKKEFLEVRASFMSKQYEISSNEYKKKFGEEWARVISKKWDELTIWFEYDLFCQLNMMALINGLISEKFRSIWLVCAGEYGHDKRRRGLGELNSGDYEALYRDKFLLSNDDLNFAVEFWESYINGDHKKLQKVLSYVSETNFSYLSEAMHAFWKRFPSDRTGLGSIEMKVLNFIHQGIQHKSKLVRELLLGDEVFGFGDLQYFNLIESMNDLVMLEGEKYYLTEKGRLVVQGTKYDGPMYEKKVLGGFNMGNFIYLEEKGIISPR